MSILARVETADGPRVGLVDDGEVRLTSLPSIMGWHDAGRPSPDGDVLDWSALEAGSVDGFRLLAPIAPPEVWAYGFTYERGPQFAASPMIPSGPAYTHAIDADRPEIFFKTTASRVVGHGEWIGIRGDAAYTAVEAELCLVVDGDANPVFFTAGNDVSAWDIEARNPLWLAQGKTYEACCALGPVAVTADELPDGAEVRCRVLRDGEVRFDGSIALAKLRWSFEELAHFAAAFNPLPPGTVLMTGTAVIRPDDESLAPGDVAEVTIDGIGTLRNEARMVESRVPFVPYR